MHCSCLKPYPGVTDSGYVVHYRYGLTNVTQSVPPSSTRLHLSNLNGGLYIVSVEATSEHLSGMSGASTVKLGNIACDCVVDGWIFVANTKQW